MRSIALVLLGLALAQAQDLTQQAGASGAQVVESVVNLIHESCVFPNDRLLLRRLAFVATNDGQDAGTFRAGFDGGIWAVSRTCVFRLNIFSVCLSVCLSVSTSVFLSFSLIFSLFCDQWLLFTRIN